MKNLKSISLAVVVMISVTLTSCKKDYISDIEASKKPATTAVSSFKEIKTDRSFNWKSSQEVTLQVEAANVPVKISNTLYVKTEKGDVLFTKLQNMDEAYQGKLTLPSSLKKVIVSYGEIVKTIDITNSAIQFNFVTESTPIEQ